MGIPLYLLVSGEILYWGLLFLAAGVFASRWRPTTSSILVWAGLVLALASAVPIHPAVYGLLVVLVVVWGGRARYPHHMRLVTGGVLGGVSLAFAAAILGHPTSGASLPTNRAIFIIGDSLSAGMGASDAGTWPQLVSRRLNQRVYNLATPGATLANGKAQAGAIPTGPATVLVELGGNDLVGGTSTARFETDLRSLLAAVVTKDRSVVVFELPLLPFQNSFGRIQREACRDMGVVLLPRSLLAGAVALPGNTTDGLHLSPTGHLWLADRLAQLWRNQ